MFEYSDDKDKSFGLAGMAISLSLWDQYDMLDSISMDAEGDDDSILFTPDFYFSTNPRFSAKIAWNEMIKQYQMSTGLILSNILCRRYVEKRQGLDREIVKSIRALIEDDGHDVCQLDSDEIDNIFETTLEHVHSIFANSRVKEIANSFAGILRERRRLSGSEVADELHALRLF